MGATRFGLVTLLLVAAFVVTTGCDRRPKRVGISGTVLIDGQPLTVGFIQFIPEDTRASMGTLDENGRFTMTCYEANDGVIPGTHRVAIMASEIISSTKIKWHAPPKYADPETSGVVVEVDKPRDDLVVEISWNGGKPYIERAGGSDREEISEDI